MSTPTSGRFTISRTSMRKIPGKNGSHEEVRQLDNKQLHWVARIGGRREEWNAEIFDQVPDQKIAWRSTSGRRNEGEMTFEKIADNQTRVQVTIVYEPHGALEKAGSAVGVVDGRVKGDLKRFKEFIEQRQEATGAWRGEIHGSQVDPESGAGARSKRLREMPTDPQKTPGTNVP